MPKGSQNGTKNDVNTQQKHMPKLAMKKKIKKVIKNHISLKAKIINIH